MQTQTTQELKPEDTVVNILTGKIINPEQYANYMIYENHFYIVNLAAKLK